MHDLQKSAAYAGAASLSNQAQSQGYADTAPNPPATVIVLQRLAQVLMAVREAGDRTRDIADRHLGSQPQPAEAKTGPTPVPNGSMAQMMEQLDYIGGALAHLDNQIARVEQI